MGTPLYERYERLPFLRRPPAFFAAFFDFFWIGFFAIFFGRERKFGSAMEAGRGGGMQLATQERRQNNRAAVVPTPSAHTTLRQRMHRQSALPQALTWERLVDGKGGCGACSCDGVEGLARLLQGVQHVGGRGRTSKRSVCG